MQQYTHTKDLTLNTLEKKIQFYRKHLDIDTKSSQDIWHKIATNRDELEAAYSLLHDIFVKKGYCDPEPSRIRISHWNAIPGAVTAISIRKNKVISTVTVCPDSRLGLPMDSIYPKQLDDLRSQGQSIAEIGGLASEINDQSSLLHLLKLIMTYTNDHLHLDVLVNTVHPKTMLFYKAIFGAKQISDVKAYAAVKNNPAVALSLDLSKIRKIIYNYSQSMSVEKDMYRFLYQTDSKNINLPENLNSLSIWDLDLLNYFFVIKTDIFNRLSSYQRDFFMQHYGPRLSSFVYVDDVIPG